MSSKHVDKQNWINNDNNNNKIAWKLETA